MGLLPVWRLKWPHSVSGGVGKDVPLMAVSSHVKQLACGMAL